MMRHIPTAHYHKIMPGVPTLEFAEFMPCAAALEHAYAHGSRSVTETISVGIPDPLISKVCQGLQPEYKYRSLGITTDIRINEALLNTIASARRTDLLARSKPHKYPTKGRRQMKLTLPLWLSGSIKVIAHACEVSMGDVAAWAIEVEAGRKK